MQWCKNNGLNFVARNFPDGTFCTLTWALTHVVIRLVVIFTKDQSFMLNVKVWHVRQVHGKCISLNIGS